MNFYSKNFLLIITTYYVRYNIIGDEINLIIGISTDSARVSPHFGRAPEFTIVRIENDKVVEKKVVPNPGHSVGNIPNLMKTYKVDYMVTGGMGHRAREFFNDFNIEIITGVEGDIEGVIDRILNGEIKNLQGENLCNPSGGKGYGVEKIHEDGDEHHHHH